MIRFPPTSIALSESDIDFHLNEIRIKEQLHAQGVMRKEVHRYYNQRHGYVNGIDVEGDAPSTRGSSLTFTKAGDDPAQIAHARILKGGTRKPSGRSDTKPRSHFI
jgi:hypothetical protein